MDEEEVFDWRSEDAVVVKSIAAIAVYTNPHGEVVIRQEKDGFLFDQDPFVVIPRDRVSEVIAALQKECEG
jgi:hypothetical protein